MLEYEPSVVFCLNVVRNKFQSSCNYKWTLTTTLVSMLGPVLLAPPVVSGSGHIITNATHSIHIFEPEEGFYEQSSDNIWHACCKVVQV